MRRQEPQKQHVKPFAAEFLSGKHSLRRKEEQNRNEKTRTTEAKCKAGRGEILIGEALLDKYESEKSDDVNRYEGGERYSTSGSPIDACSKY